MNNKEVLVRDLAPKVYGEGSVISVSRNNDGGILRVLDSEGFMVASEGWEPTRTSCKTEEQAWHNILECVKDDARDKGISWSMESKYSVGDGVVVVDTQDRAISRHTVSSIGHGWVNCSDGLQFRETREDIRKWRVGDGVEIRRTERAEKLTVFADWDKLTREEMDTVWNIVSKYRRKK